MGYNMTLRFMWNGCINHYGRKVPQTVCDNIQKSRSLNPFIFTHKANPIDPNPSGAERCVSLRWFCFVGELWAACRVQHDRAELGMYMHQIASAPLIGRCRGDR
jgi:hypothetical protein